MFVDFDKVFKNKKQTDLKAPDALVKYLSSKLSNGLRYVMDDNGRCSITTGGNSIRIGGITLNPNKEQLKVLGENFTEDDILRYSYNAQQPIALKFEKDGYLILNGQEIPIEKLSYNPYNPVKYISGYAHIFPYEFPDPFVLEIGDQEYKQKLVFKRVPNESVNIAKYASENDKPLYIEYLLNQTKSSISLTISLNLIYAQTVKDVIESATIYNSFIDGKGLLQEIQLTNQVKANKYDEKSILFWKKVLIIEEILDKQFKPPFTTIDFETACNIEKLYQNLVNNTPIRFEEKITSITADSVEDVKNSLGKELFLQFHMMIETSLFGETINLPCLMGTYNAVLSKYTRNGKKYIVSVEDASKERKACTSAICFKSEADLKEFLNRDHNDVIEQFKEAKKVYEYFEI